MRLGAHSEQLDPSAAITTGLSKGTTIAGVEACRSIDALIGRFIFGSIQMVHVNENAIPEWADESLSRDLPVLRARGEGQEMEYMARFPSNTRELGKEIAAFATSQGGMILIGVDDSGELIGLPECATAGERDQTMRRLEGITHGTIKPAITPTARFAVESGHIVLVLSVPKGSQPVYYSSNTPYIRHLTEARPAEPHEVIERIAEYVRNSGAAQESEIDDRSRFYSDAARILVEILLLADEVDERRLNPWLDQWRSEYGYAASQLRDLAASQIAVEEGVHSELRDLATALEKVAKLRLHIGSADELSRATDAAATLARSFMERHIDRTPLIRRSLDLVRDAVIKSSRKLQDIASRARDMVNSGRIEELQAEASALGHEIVRLSYLNTLGENIRQELRNVGRLLHLTETMRLLSDGGISLQAVIDRVENCNAGLSLVAEKLKS